MPKWHILQAGQAKMHSECNQETIVVMIFQWHESYAYVCNISNF